MSSAFPASPGSRPDFTIKICGLSTPETLETAIGAGADLIGLVFHPKSPRFVTVEQATSLAAAARNRTGIVALIVNFDEKAAQDLVRAVRPDWLQLHGSESVALTAAIGKTTGIRIMKVVGIGAAADLALVPHYLPASDAILLDAKPPKDATYPGGHGRMFDWEILRGLDPAIPFLLSGGLDPGNVATAITRIRAMRLNLAGVDVSSGVESAPGVKDSVKIRDFIQAARGAVSGAQP
jgi:phosphoribosylanthranilate isomerase